MKQIHRQEKEQFKKLFRQERFDRFEDRFRILVTFLNTESHITTNELIAQVNATGSPLGADFVRDTLHLLCRFGFAVKTRFEDGLVRYEHRHMCQHHDHLICTRCGTITEFEHDALERLQVQIADMHGFHMLRHSMEIYGLCRLCMQDRARRIPLSATRSGERVVIRELTGGSESQMRLLAMGLRVGDEIEVITNNGHGQLVLAVDCKRYALGRGLAQKIRVEGLDGPDKATCNEPAELPVQIGGRTTD